MTDQEFTRKLQNILIEMSQVWFEPQWEALNEKLLIQQFCYTDLDTAQETFAHAEQLINPTEEPENIVDRVERWKLERQG